MSDCDEPWTQPAKKNITPTKRRPDDDDDVLVGDEQHAASPVRRRLRKLCDAADDASPPTQPAPVLYKGRTAKEAIGRRVAVTYIEDGVRIVYTGTVLEVEDGHKLTVKFSGDEEPTEITEHPDDEGEEGDEWDWAAEQPAPPQPPPPPEDAAAEDRRKRREGKRRVE